MHVRLFARNWATRIVLSGGKLVRFQFVTLETADNVELDGIVLQPIASARSRIGIVLIHGLRWNFYRGPSRWLATLLAATGYPVLSVSLRDHDSTEIHDFEMAHHDLHAAIDFMSTRTDEVALLAHGHGGSKVICYPAQSGDRRVRLSILVTFGAVQSYQPAVWSAVVAGASAMRGHILVVQGADDKLISGRERANDIARAATSCETTVVLMDGANHYFAGREEQLVRRVDDWLLERSVLRSPPA
jgi:alpha-beta hydrolase superfamily lysophospholipase